MTVRPASTAGGVLQALVAARVGVLLGELGRAEHSLRPGPVHKVRVAARSLRSLLGTAKPLLDPASRNRACRDLRSLAIEYEELHQADVRRRWLSDLAARSAELAPDAQRWLDDALRRSRVRARRHCRAHTRSVAYAERRLRLQATLASPALVQPGHAPEAILRKRLQRRWKRLHRALLARPTASRRLHRLRLAAKHARYSSEHLMPLLGIDPRHALRQLKRLQDCLGEYRDAAEALDWLSGLPDPLAPALLLALRQPIRRVMDRRRRELRKLSDDFEMPDLSMPA